MAMLTGSGERAQINVTPMIDVLLVLIIIFMVITPTRSRGFNTAVPQPAPPGAPAEETDDVVITVRPGQSFLLNQQPLDLTGLRTRLGQVFAPGTSRPLFVRGEGDLQFHDIAEVIDLARSLGIYRVALIS
jgi:biopolymer transport protein ExbD